MQREIPASRFPHFSKSVGLSLLLLVGGFCLFGPQLFPPAKARPELPVTGSTGLPQNDSRVVVNPAVPNITAVLSAVQTGTDNGCTGPSPTDTLRYSVTITNAGTDATGVSYTDSVPSNTTLVAGTVRVSPIAVDDAYSSIGNVGIDVPAGSGVTANDTPGVNPAGAVTGFGNSAGTANGTAPGGTVTTTNNGTVVLQSSGAFTYLSAAGFEGTDTFFYTFGNAAGGSVGTVTVTVAGMIWFIDNNAGTNGNGRLNAPFNNLPAFQAVNNGTGNNPAANDNIFLYRQTATNYAGPLTLLNNQRLIGQGALASLATITGISVPPFSNALPATGGTNPVISHTATNLTLGNGNTVRGVTLTSGAAGAVNLSGNGFGTVLVDDVTLNGTGPALNLTTGTLSGATAATANFQSLSSSGSSATVVSLTTVNGTLTVGGGSITGTTAGSCVSVSGGNVGFNSYGGSLTQASNNPLVSVSGGHTGTLTFQTGTLSATNGTGLQFDNADGTYNFNGTTTLNGGDAGIDIINGSTGTFSFSSNTSITNPTNAGFNLSGATASNATVTYSGSISKNNAGFAIDIDNHDANTVTFQTGTISSTGTGSGIRVQNSNGGTINFNNGTKTLTTGTNNAVTLSSNAGAAINFASGGLAITTTSGT
ncbi:MAG: hypothetical protein K1Y36_26470, partial [Blastocatellia bacterium]|nr:hypothetical protein [Blastocatellia bacterium]